MTPARRLMAAMLTLAVAGCAGAPSGGEVSQVPGTPQAAFPSSVDTDVSTVAATPLGSDVPVALLLPRELGGVELHTFATGQDSVARLLATVGATSLELEVAYASDHGARFRQLFALRVRGVDGETLLNAFATAAYDPAAGTVNRTQEEVGGKAVSVINQPISAQRIGTFYAYVLGDALLVAQTLDRPTAEECLAAMP